MFKVKPPEDFFYQATLKSPHAIAAIGTNSRFLWVNDEFCKLTGYSETELITLSWPEITLQEDIGSDLLELNKVLEGETSHYTLTKKYIRKNGDLLDIELIVYRYPPGGDVLMLIAYIKNLMTTDTYIKKIIIELEEIKSNYKVCAKALDDPNRLLYLIRDVLVANWGIITTVFGIVAAVSGWIITIIVKAWLK